MNEVIGLIVLTLHTAGFLSALHALMHSKQSQSVIAWGLGLCLFPYLTLPAYWIFGLSKESTSVDLKKLRAQIASEDLLLKAHPATHLPKPEESSQHRALEKLARAPWTRGNDVQLLIDGGATFAAIFSAIEEAKEYVLVEFFIVHDDELGRELKIRLLRKVREGVRVYFLYDGIGSHGLPAAYVRELREGGVQIHAFKVRELVNRFQVNFRNHRKIVVVDGDRAFVGGHNVGDEYLGKSHFGHWRDTHIAVKGPGVFAIQQIWASDWFVCKEKIPDLKWETVAAASAETLCLTVPSDPLIHFDHASLSLTQAIHQAKKRVWITSPYFIPDEKILAALRLKALEGVDVRILLPNQPDHFLVYMAAFSYLDDIANWGISIYRYQKGFLHQKVLLVDDEFASVGTANLDNRSFHLNFELIVFCVGKVFAGQVAKMLEADFANALKITHSEYREKPFLTRVVIRFARLFSPIL